jgi:flagella basal body P-ring formation protein FlgA
MIISLLNILISVMVLGDTNTDIGIQNYLEKQMLDYNKIEYDIVSPITIDLSSCFIDENREFKTRGNYAYLPIKQKNENGSFSNKLVTLRLKLFKKVYVANRSIERDEYLDANYFMIKEKEVSSLRFEPIEVRIPLNKLRAKFKIDENSILQEGMVDKISDIKVGDRIHALFTNNSVNISFGATARSEGLVGDIIDVKRDDKQIFKARILNNTTVKIIE